MQGMSKQNNTIPWHGSRFVASMSEQVCAERRDIYEGNASQCSGDHMSVMAGTVWLIGVFLICARIARSDCHRTNLYFRVVQTNEVKLSNVHLSHGTSEGPRL